MDDVSRKADTGLYVWVSCKRHTSIFFNVHRTVQKKQFVVFCILLHELDVDLHQVDVLHESLHFLSFDLDPGVVHISEPVAWCCSFV